MSNDTANSISGTMGIISSRAFLCIVSQFRENQVYSERHIKPIFAPDRLVRNELRKEVQCRLPYEKPKARDSLSFIQISSESLQ